jgi:hypothetical protein
MFPTDFFWKRSPFDVPPSSMDTLLIGMLRPVRQVGPGAADVEPVGNVNAAAYYVNRLDDGVVELRGVTTLPWTKDAASADGTALYREDGTLIAWWAITAAIGEDLTIGGWRFRLTHAIDLTVADRQRTAASD